MVRQFQASTGCSTVEALEAATLHPAKVLGLQHQKGTLNFGSDADFVILDQNLVPQATYLGGNLAWSRDSKQQAS
jgi:N-acetylglucosamine-6-phosphate deacetylase